MLHETLQRCGFTLGLDNVEKNVIPKKKFKILLTCRLTLKIAKIVAFDNDQDALFTQIGQLEYGFLSASKHLHKQVFGMKREKGCLGKFLHQGNARGNLN